MKNNILIFSILLVINYGINAVDHFRDHYRRTLEDQKCNCNFFERSEQQKTFARFEYTCTSGNLNFFLTHDHLDPKIYGFSICQYAREYSHHLHVAIRRKLAEKAFENETINKNDLSKISKHAVSQCHLCVDLELKRRKGEILGTIPTESKDLFVIWPYGQGDGKKFYDNACGDFYKKLSDEKLQQIREVTK